ncbi:MAG: tetratricopeptide repeat protein [Deltaproteobacteria bacterium]|nr:tetratricopeptide repeat protein [Deltaproteobacteria bacterium]
MRKHLAVLACCLIASAGFAACGGGAQKKSNLPATMGSAPPGKTVTNDSGQQVGISDAPSSVSNVPVAERPKMNESARGPYMQALEAFGRGELDAAKKGFQEAVSKDSKAYQAYYSLGVVLERLRDPDALTQYRQAFTIVTDYEPAITAYGLALARRGNTSESDQFLTERHAKMPKSAAVTAALAECKSIQRDTGSAQSLAQEALKLNPNYPPAMVTLARDHYRNRRLDLADYALTAILDGVDAENPPRDKENPEARLLRALIYREQGNRPAAIRELDQVVKVRPDLVDATVQLATYYLEAGNADKALPLLERALKYDNSDVTAHLNVGDCYRLLGRPQDAKREFDWVLAKDSSLVQVQYDLGLLYLYTPNYPGMTPTQQTDLAIAAFEKYQAARTRGATGPGSDVEELILRAKAKKALIESNAAAATPAPGPSGSSTPPAAASGKAPAAASAAASAAKAGTPAASSSAPK